jgi:pentapeptide MXKDX repeat protein
VKVSNKILKRTCSRHLLAGDRNLTFTPWRTTMKTRFLLAALITTGLASAPAFAMDDMSKDKMAKEKMEKKDKMSKTSKMKKTDSMDKKDSMSNDGMKKH